MSPATVARRAFVQKEWREAVSEDSSVQTAHPLAPQMVEESYLATEADAQSEADRRQTLRGTQRDRYEIMLELNDDTKVLDLGDVVTLTLDRFSMSGGMDFRIIGVEPDFENSRLRLTLWG